MKTKMLIIFLSALMCTNLSFGQLSGTYKICPSSGFWQKNLNLVTDKNFMFEEYALGPDGCWYLKSATHSSYKTGYYQFSKSKKYYYKNKVWSDENKTYCLAKSPFGK
jgi:hypothetical protein